MIFKKWSVLYLYILVEIFTIVEGQQCNGGANCIALENCTGLYTQLLKGNTVQLTSLLRSLHCGFEEFDKPKICCPPEFLAAKPTTTPLDPLTLLPSNTACGIHSADRIYGGQQTDIDEHIWLALIKYDKPLGSGFYCGGVLISKRYVLTAAHCVKGADLPPSWKISQVRLGEWNTSSPVDCIDSDCSRPVQDIPVEEIIAHEDYDPDDKDQQADIALLRLSKDAQFHDFLQPICLPLDNNLKRATFEGYENLEVAGWGKTETRTESEVKLKVQVPIVNNAECANVYKRVDRVITSTQMCAGGVAGKDSCRGDSGGPLMGRTPDANYWMVLGIVSYGPSPCGTEGWPGVYTKVGAYVDWILSKLRP